MEKVVEIQPLSTLQCMQFLPKGVNKSRHFKFPWYIELSNMCVNSHAITGKKSRVSLHTSAEVLIINLRENNPISTPWSAEQFADPWPFLETK